MKQNIITRSGFLFKTMLLAGFLLFANIASSSAQYVQLEVDASSPDIFVWTIQMKVYSDAACTIPTTFSGDVNYKTVSYFGCEQTPVPADQSMTINDFNASNFLFLGLYVNPQYCEDIGGHIEDIIDAWGGFRTGSGYTVASTPVVYSY